MTQCQTSDQMFRKLMSLATRRHAAVPADVSEYDWQSPNCFTLAQVQRLRDLGAAAAKRIAAALSKLLRSEVALDPVAVNLRYGRAAMSAYDKADAFFIALADAAGDPAGCLVVPGAAATKFVSKFLGAGGDGDAARKLSPLEQELLMDVVRAVCNEFSAELVAAGGKPLQPGAIDRSAPPGIGQSECGAFAMGAAGELPMLAVIVPCGFLESVFAASGLTTELISPEESTRRMTAHLQEVPVTTSVSLGESELSMKDVLALSQGDVLLLSTQVGQPVELRTASGSPLAMGLLAGRDGNFALQITHRAPCEAAPAPHATPANETTKPSGKA